MEEDPYRPPQDGGEPDRRLFERQALVEIVRGWEKLRIPYNLILLLPGLGVTGWWLVEQRLPAGLVIVEVILVAIGANLAFLLGPVAELYFRALFRKGEPIGVGRWLIFGAGLVVSAGVFMAVVFFGVV